MYTIPDTAPMLRAGIRISESYRQALHRAGITTVWVDDELSEGIEPLELLTEETKERATLAIRDAFRDVSRSGVTGGVLGADTLKEMTRVAEVIASDIAQSAQTALALNDLANADGYTMRHSLAVTALGLSIGLRVMRKYGWVDFRGERRFDGIEQRLSMLGVGLLLHDIGKLAVPAQVLHKPGPLNDDEWIAMRDHPMIGYGILKDAQGISPLARTVVRSHHERWNGTGYPDRKAANDIHQFARIAAVADVFDALTSDRPYRAAEPAHVGYKYVIAGSGRDFDPEVVEIFKAAVAPFPPGTGVVLSDGCRAVVKDVKPDFVMRPVVRIVRNPQGEAVTPYEIDLNTTPRLEVVSSNFNPWA